MKTPSSHTRSAPHPRPTHPRSKSIQSRRIVRVPAFTPVPVRARRDGWTPARQAAFIGWLAETRCVKTAAVRVGLSRESAYRLRRKAGAAEFCAAWDRIMGGGLAASSPTPQPRARKVTPATLDERARHVRLRPILRSGRYIGSERKADNSALIGALARADRLSGD